MRYALSILLFCFAAGLLLSALIIRHDPKAIPRYYAAKMSNPKEYARQFSHLLLILALPPVLLGLLGLFLDPGAHVLLFGILSVVLLAGAIFWCTRLWHPD